MKKIALFGASGFIGQHLVKVLDRYDIHSIRSSYVYKSNPDALAKELEGHDAIVNLAGESIFSLWTDKKKEKIYNSRIHYTQKIIDAAKACSKPPSRLINASAVGIYASGIVADEKTEAYADNFLAKTVRDWEKVVFSASGVFKNISVLRFGIVLGKGGGAYQILRFLTKNNLGGYFGKGDQDISFIYIMDLANAIKFVIEKDLDGVINITAPSGTTYNEFVHVLKEKLNSRIVWPVPEIIPKIFAGETSVLFLEGQIVRPVVLIKNNFNFEAPDIRKCIEQIERN